MKIQVIKSWNTVPNADFLLLSDNVLAKIITVPEFEDSASLQLEVKTAANKFRPYAEMQEADISKSIRARINAARSELALALNRLAIYVELYCKNNAILVEDTGFSVRPSNRPLGVPPKCKNLRISTNNRVAGEVALLCEPYSGAASYEVEYRILGEESAKSVTFPSSRMHVSGLDFGKQYTFRAGYVGRGKAGRGDWSAELTASVPS